MQLSIIIVNWNSGAQLSTCIESIENYSEGLVKQIVVVDNGSTDGSDTGFEGLSNVTMIRTGSNIGFGKACNLGALYTDNCEYLLFLNPDAALYAQTLSKLLDNIKNGENGKAGIFSVQLLDGFGQISRSCARFPKASSILAHALGLVYIFPSLGQTMADWEHVQTRVVDQVIGAFFLVRRELFETLHGFDERFFMYFEEVDFSYRASKAGWCSVYFAGTQAFHAGGGTSKQVKARRLFYSLRSRLLFAFKHFSWSRAVIVLTATLLLEPLSRSALALLRGSWPGFTETWSAYGMLWRWLPQWVFKGVTH